MRDYVRLVAVVVVVALFTLAGMEFDADAGTTGFDWLGRLAVFAGGVIVALLATFWGEDADDAKPTK